MAPSLLSLLLSTHSASSPFKNNDPSLLPSMDGEGDSGVADDGGSGGDNNRSGRGQIPGRQNGQVEMIICQGTKTG